MSTLAGNVYSFYNRGKQSDAKIKKSVTAQPEKLTGNAVESNMISVLFSIEQTQKEVNG